MVLCHRVLHNAGVMVIFTLGCSLRTTTRARGFRMEDDGVASKGSISGQASPSIFDGEEKHQRNINNGIENMAMKKRQRRNGVGMASAWRYQRKRHDALPILRNGSVIARIAQSFLADECCWAEDGRE